MTLPDAMSDLISLSRSKWFFLEMTLTLAPVSLLPLGDARVERLVLLAADQLGVDGDAVEFAGQIGGKAAPHAKSEQHHAGRNAGKQSCSLVPP